MTEFGNLTASELMTAGVQRISPEASLREAARKMVEMGMHCLLVDPPSERRTAGIITSKDIVQLLGDADPAVLDELYVREVMTAPAITVHHDQVIADCIKLMRMTGVRRVFVVDKDRVVVGLLSFTAVLRAAVT